MRVEDHNISDIETEIDLLRAPLTNYQQIVNKLVTKLLSNCLDDKSKAESSRVLEELEKIDDECDQHSISFVKIDNPEEAKEYGIDSVPSLIYFENGIPSVFEGLFIYSFNFNISI